MAKLIYFAITSLDGYVADERGKFDWSAPDDEVHAFVNDLQRDVLRNQYPNQPSSRASSRPANASDAAE